MNYKIAIIGPRASTNGFRALGFTREVAHTPEETREKIIELRSQIGENGKPQYAVIYVLEELGTTITDEDWKNWSQSTLPAITMIPTGIVGSNLATMRIKKIVERAVGSDILG